KSFDQVPGYGRPHRTTAHAQHIHVVVFHSLPGGKMIVDERGANARNLVGADRRADAAAANGDASLDLPCRNGPCKWNDKIRVIASLIDRRAPKINYFIPGGAKLREDGFLKGKTAMIGCKANTHNFPFVAQWIVTRRLRRGRQ